MQSTNLLTNDDLYIKKERHFAEIYRPHDGVPPNEDAKSADLDWKKIAVIDTVIKARIALNRMESVPEDTIFACDTEVADIDVKTQGLLITG
jgi:hypothetical protein